MGMKSASKKLGRFLLFVLFIIIVVPIVFVVVGSSPVTENIGAGHEAMKSLMVPFLVFRFGIYLCIYYFYRPITLHFTRKLEFSEADTEYALTKRNNVVIYIILFEALITASLLLLMA